MDLLQELRDLLDDMPYAPAPTSYGAKAREWREKAKALVAVIEARLSKAGVVTCLPGDTVESKQRNLRGTVVYSILVPGRGTYCWSSNSDLTRVDTPPT